MLRINPFIATQSSLRFFSTNRDLGSMCKYFTLDVTLCSKELSPTENQANEYSSSDFVFPASELPRLILKLQTWLILHPLGDPGAGCNLGIKVRNRYDYDSDRYYNKLLQPFEVLRGFEGVIITGLDKSSGDYLRSTLIRKDDTIKDAWYGAMMLFYAEIQALARQRNSLYRTYQLCVRFEDYMTDVFFSTKLIPDKSEQGRNLLTMSTIVRLTTAYCDLRLHTFAKRFRPQHISSIRTICREVEDLSHDYHENPQLHSEAYKVDLYTMRGVVHYKLKENKLRNRTIAAARLADCLQSPAANYFHLHLHEIYQNQVQESARLGAEGLLDEDADDSGRDYFDSSDSTS